MQDFINTENWRIFRIMAEFIESIEFMTQAGTSVTMFGSARISEDDKHYKLAEEIACRFSKKGISVITGGGPGIMEAGNRGAKRGEKGKSIGLNIVLPYEQLPNSYIGAVKDFHYFFIRKVMFIKYAKAILIFPGGFGTMDEFFEALTLIQTNKIAKVPVILIGKDFWHPIIKLIEEMMLKSHFISEEDLEMFTLTDDPNEAVEVVETYMNETQRTISDNLTNG